MNLDAPRYLKSMTDQIPLTEEDKSAIIEMALSDHTPFSTIEAEYGLKEKDVKTLMRQSLKPGSYRAWR